jgi:predicted peptidase
VGDKSEDAIVRMCQYFASMGYTTATINYRMGFLPTKASSERAGYMALQDAHAALRFLFENANKYRIDTNYVFVGGSSAGGITSLNLAFMQNKNRPESSYKSLLHDDLGNIESAGKFNNTKIHINAIANLWGAVSDLAVLKNNKVSVLSYHSAKDPIVPYDYDYPMQKFAKKVAPLLFTKMYGSKAIHEELKKLKYREKLVTIQQEAHNLWETNDKINTIFYQIFNDMKQFFYVDLVPNPVKIEQDALFRQRYFISNTNDIELITLQCDGGFIIQNNENEILVIWRRDATDRRLTTSGIYKNGAAFKTEITK